MTWYVVIFINGKWVVDPIGEDDLRYGSSKPLPFTIEGARKYAESTYRRFEGPYASRQDAQAKADSLNGNGGATRKKDAQADYELLERGEKYALIQQGDMTLVVRLSDGQVVSGSKFKGVIKRNFEKLERGQLKESQLSPSDGIKKLRFSGIGKQASGATSNQPSLIDHDRAHRYTDEQIESLKRRFRKTYGDASKEMRGKLDNLMAAYDKKNSEWKARVKSGEATQKEYAAWLKDMAQDRRFVQGMADRLAQDAVNADKLAMDYINDAIPQVYAENANYAAYQIEQAIGYDTHSFDIYDQSTVRRLIAEPDAPLLPKPKVDVSKDRPWNQRKFSSAIAQSILQGESISNTAKRLQMVLNMDERAATRAARTAMTGAENAGRVDSYKRAERIGIQLEQQWLATFDERTRISHRELHGQHKPVGEYFIASTTSGAKLLYPGDPSAPSEEVYNCRCTLGAWLPNIEQDERPLWTDWKDGTTYEEWKAGKTREKSDGPIIAGVSKGASMTFDEANRMRGNATRNNAQNRRAYLRNILGRDATTDEYIRYGNGTTVNCQSCVVANELRRRGYDVSAVPNMKEEGSAPFELSKDCRSAWIDPSTGEKPDEIMFSGRSAKMSAFNDPMPTPSEYHAWLSEALEDGARYHISTAWNNGGAHVMCLDKDENGRPRIYDPQNGKSYVGGELEHELSRMCMGGNEVPHSNKPSGFAFSYAPHIYRVDNMDINVDVVSGVVYGTQNV